MTEPTWAKGPPTRILLATDLSARCDRAMDRAASLAHQWNAQLVVLHILEDLEASAGPDAPRPSWVRPPDPAGVVKRQLVADLGALASKAKVLVQEGEPGDVILRTAEAEGCDLIVVGIARDELFGRFALGKTVDRLLRGSRMPVLVVKDRARAPYRHIVVTTDLSECSRPSLEAAMSFFPGEKLTVFHAYDAPMAGLMSDAAAYRREYRAVAAKACNTFIESVVSEKPGRIHPDVFIEDGDPVDLLRDYVRDKGADLAVLGTHGRSAVMEILLGSVAKRILDRLPCDTLIVRAPRAAVEA